MAGASWQNENIELDNTTVQQAITQVLISSAHIGQVLYPLLSLRGILGQEQNAVTRNEVG